LLSAHVTDPSLLILGTDAVLAAGPATPVQLAHACREAGYDAVIPASWGDELVAARALERLGGTDLPLIYCSCPHVSLRLAAHGEAIGSMLLCMIAPPVAAAEYLRAIYAPSRPHITFAGACPAASHESIDSWISAEELLLLLADRGISTQAQPTEFDSVIPPDRRRYFSDPGGVPCRQALRQLSESLEIVEVRGDDVVLDLAQQLLQKRRVLIDLSVPLGCTCSGMVTGMSPEAARPRVREQEPPRAFAPVVDHAMSFPLDGVPPRIAPREMNRTAFQDTNGTPVQPHVEVETAPLATDMIPRRRSSPGLPRPVLGSMPLKRTDTGRQLPRAYVARRRSSPRDVPAVEAALGRDAPAAPRPRVDRDRLLLIGTAGVVVGLAVAWLISLLPRLIDWLISLLP
jgi:hypothetical protein